MYLCIYIVYVVVYMNNSACFLMCVCVYIYIYIYIYKVDDPKAPFQ